MKLNNTFTGVIAAAALAAVSATAAMAQTSTVLASSTGSTSPNVTFTSGSSFTGTDPATLYVDRTTNTALFSTPFMLNAGTLGSFTTASTGDTQNFISGGSFSYGTGSSVLAGTFTTSTLTQTGNSTFAFVANDVVFTGGSHLDGFSTGALQLEAINATPTSGTSFVNASGTGFNSFTATDGVTISAVKASTVPEPATVVPFLLGGLGLMALIVPQKSQGFRRHCLNPCVSIPALLLKPSGGVVLTARRSLLADELKATPADEKPVFFAFSPGQFSPNIKSAGMALLSYWIYSLNLFFIMAVAPAKSSSIKSSRPVLCSGRLGFDLRLALPFAAALVLLGILAWPVLRFWAYEYTKPESYYSHAPLIPLIAGLMLWHKRAALAAAVKHPALPALGVLLPGLAMLVFALKIQAEALESTGLLLSITAGVWLVLGGAFMRAAWFPLSFLWLLAPLPGPVLNEATQRVQMLSTVLADKLLHLMSFGTTLTGNVIQMEDYSLFVDVPCSGFKLLLALLTFSAAFAFLVDGPLARKLALFAFSLPLSLLVNSVRIALIGVVGECVGAPAAHVFHDYSGMITLTLGFAALFGLAKGLGCRTFAGWAIF